MDTEGGAGVTVASGGLGRLAARLRGIVGDGGVITERSRLRTYECDGLAVYKTTPGIVVLPETAEQVAGIVAACAAERVPYVARGSGTGLSGGALPRADGVLIVTSRMRRILEVDIANERAVVEPGVVNLDVTKEARPYGYYYAPDPSSQQICSIGGNVAENSGGAHCLKYGFTTNHVLGLELVTPDGEIVELGGKAPDPPGYDLMGVLIGSEGTLGIVTKVTVRLMRAPEEVRTLLTGFGSTDEAATAVSGIIGAGVVPAAVEMMDALAIEAAEAATGCGYPEAGAVLIIQLDGPAAEVETAFREVDRHCREAGAFEMRVAADEAERALIWKGRKSAFASVGRLSRDYIVQDGVIPRSALPEVLNGIAELSESSGLRVANVFHAGDGNLHPLVLFDESAGESEQAEQVSGAVLDLCISHGGSITGEHGIGADKVAHLPRMFTADDLDTMQLVRCAFDPAGLCNPGKIFPTPRLCGEVPGKHKGAHPLAEAGVAEVSDAGGPRRRLPHPPRRGCRRGRRDRTGLRRLARQRRGGCGARRWTRRAGAFTSCSKAWKESHSAPRLSHTSTRASGAWRA